MAKLSDRDLKQLIVLLKDLPALANERSRQNLFYTAGLSKLTPMMDLSGPSISIAPQIVYFLENYGRFSYESEALGVFLNTMKEFVGVQQQDFLDRLLLDYDMMTPIAASPRLDRWQGKENPADIFEKIIGENNLRPIAFLQQGLEVARSVAYIGVSGNGKRWSGTGFLVAERLLLTNNHVLPSRDLLSGSNFRFNYQENSRGEMQAFDEYKANETGIFYTNPDLDYTLVELEKAPGETWGWLRCRGGDIRRNDRINIIQHPYGQPKQISLQNNFVQYVGGNVVQYVTSTCKGSSGSPVFNDSWEVVAVHHAGGNISEPTTQQQYFRNEGILIQRILADLPPDVKARLDD